MDPSPIPGPSLPPIPARAIRRPRLRAGTMPAVRAVWGPSVASANGRGARTATPPADIVPPGSSDRASAAGRRAAGFAPRRTRAGLLAAAVLVSAAAGCTRHDLPGCIETREGCLAVEAFDERTAALAEDARAQPNFPAQWGLAAINAHEAYAHLALAAGEDVEPGAGQTIGIVDTGIDEAHPLFYGKKVTEEFLENAVDETGERYSHGTAVASVLAGVRIPAVYYYPHGVAPGADLQVFAIPLGTAPEYYRPISLEVLARVDADEAALYEHVLAWEDDRGRLDFLNLSLGYSGLIEAYGEEDLRASFGETIEVFAQRDAAEKTIFVWAGGNAHGTKCTQDASWCVEFPDGEHRVDARSISILPGLPTHFEELRGHHLAVVAVGPDGTIAEFSNRCGGADWCLAAPGNDVLVAYFGPGRDGPGLHALAETGGTSVAAPMVTGGLAVMKHVFRDQLANTELAARLLETADRTGPYADAAVYGRGMMDLGAATSPVGMTEVPVSATMQGASAPLPSTGLAAGGAIGNGLSRSFAGREIAAFDALGAPFWYDLGDLVRPPAPPSAGERLREFVAAPSIAPWSDEPDAGAEPAALRLGFGRTPGDAGVGHARLAPNSFTVTVGRPGHVVATAFTNEGDDRRDARPASGALVSWRAADAPLGLRAGWLGERRSMLSASAEGAFGHLAADSLFVAVDLHHRAGGWRFSGGPEFGLARPSARGGIIAGVEPLATSAFALHASRPTAGDGLLQVSLAQPLRVEDGDAELSVPVGRTRDRAVVRERLSADLTPGGRQLDLSVRWERPLAGGELRLGTVATRHAGHDADARPEVSFLAAWRASF